MNLQQHLCGHLKTRAELVATGISSAEALNIVTAPIVADTIRQNLSNLSTFQIDILLHSITNNKYLFNNKEFKVTGITLDKGEFIFSLNNTQTNEEQSIPVPFLTDEMILDINNNLRRIK